jgi:hypothetical protein
VGGRKCLKWTGKLADGWWGKGREKKKGA